MKSKIAKPLRILLLLACIAVFGGAIAGADTRIIEDGVPNAEIVIQKGPAPPRMVALAALELQLYLQKMSGARLPIVTEPGGKPVRIYVGRSAATDRLGVTDKDLDYGAFRVVAGDDYLALLGRDWDFVPPEPVARRRGDPKLLKAWDQKVGDRTDAAWGYHLAGTHMARWIPKDYDAFMTRLYGEDNRWIWAPSGVERSYRDPGKGAGGAYWFADEGGSLSAVYQFLRDQGVRWYMPGELGEVVPKNSTIPLPTASKTVRPDYRLRCWLVTRRRDWDGNIWKRRVGITAAFETLGYGGAHGMGNLLIRPEMKKKHPEYFALINGKRMTALESGGPGEVCFSSDGLVDESVAYLKFRFDEYGEKMVQFSPPDGLRKCQCPQCKDVPASDLVFGFLDRVARRLYETHPDHMVLGAAYTSYQAPPEGIETLSPNIAVTLNNCGRPRFTDPEKWEEYWKKVEGWRKKLAPERLMRTENNRYEVRRPVGFPVIHPHAMAKDLRALKGISLGDRNEISIGAKTVLNAPGLSHLTLYVNARFLWDADQDVEKLLEEYYRKFFGPARSEMKAALEYAEANNSSRGGRRSGMDYEAGAGLIDRLLAARFAAGDTVYRRRIELMLTEIVPENVAGAPDDLAERASVYAEQLRKRADVLARRDPKRGFGWWNLGNSKWRKARENARMDGILDEAYWRRMRGFRDKNGKATAFQVLFTSTAMHVGIRCQVDPKDKLVVKTDKDEDPAVLDGEHVALLLETDTHSFYQIAVNPAGAVLSHDLSDQGKTNPGAWKSQVEAAAHVGHGFWSVEMRVPIDHTGGDPYHKVVARRIPRKAFPWFFNIVNVRLNKGGKTLSAFSPPKEGDPYDPANFAKLAR